MLAKNGLTGADIDCFISHQANMRIITATADRLKMPREKVIINIEDYGNTTAGTIPLAMKTAIESGRLKKGDTLLIASVGAGFTGGRFGDEVGVLEQEKVWDGERCPPMAGTFSCGGFQNAGRA